MFSLNSFSPINHSTFQSSGTPSRLVQLVEWCLGSHHHSCTNWASNGSYGRIFWCWNSAIIIPYISLVFVKMQLVYGVMPLRVLCSMITTLIVCTLPKGCTWAYNVALKHRQIWKTVHHTALLLLCDAHTVVWLTAIQIAYLWTATLHYHGHSILHGCLSHSHHCSEEWICNYLAYYILAFHWMPKLWTIIMLYILLSVSFV